MLGRGKAAAAKRLQRLLRTDDHASETGHLAGGPLLDDGRPPVTEEYAPPPGSPPSRRAIQAADGTQYTEQQLMQLVTEIHDYQLVHGSLLKIVQDHNESAVYARSISASVLPTRFPRSCFQEALSLQSAFNELYIRVASDPEWLHSVLQSLIEHDTFIATLWSVYERVRDAGAVQAVVCGVFRCDYMLHQPLQDQPVELKQVEVNPFSCAGACHAERVANMHRRIACLRGLDANQISLHLPENYNTQSIVQLLAKAHATYNSCVRPASSRLKCVLMTVQPYNFNIADERPIQYGLWDAGVPCYRCEWQTILDLTTLSADRTLFYRPALAATEFEVSVVYYRGGYDAAEYRDQSKETRVRLELSTAIKCPDILTHLTTCKSVQQALTMPGAVERFLPPDQAEKTRRTFVQMHVLDSSEAGSKARAIAQDPLRAKDYVLKPNRDGGGHNIYRAEIPAFLAAQPKDFWQNHILMRLIEPPSTVGTLLTAEDVHHGEVVSELGILGSCLWRRNDSQRVEIIVNETAGWTFKTKPKDVDEMSVVKGYGCFDCPWLVEC